MLNEKPEFYVTYDIIIKLFYLSAIKLLFSYKYVINNSL
jgi:hypothetical protein